MAMTMTKGKYRQTHFISAFAVFAVFRQTRLLLVVLSIQMGISSVLTCYLLTDRVCANRMCDRSCPSVRLFICFHSIF